MHEIGALSQAIRTIERVAREQNIRKITAVSFEVGELSGILPVFLEKYYPVAIENKPLFEGSEIKIEIIPGQGLCMDCNAVFNIVHFEGQCPRCGSRNKKILGGTGFSVKNIYIKE